MPSIPKNNERIKDPANVSDAFDIQRKFKVKPGGEKILFYVKKSFP
jgi:hypothetical protein